MKTKNLLILGAIIGGGYLLYKYFTGGGRSYIVGGVGGGGEAGMTTPPLTTDTGSSTGFADTTPTLEGFNITRDVRGQYWAYPSNVFIKYATGNMTEAQKLQQISKNLPSGTREKIVVSKILAGKI